MGLTSIVRRFRAEIRDHTTSEAFTPRKRTHTRTPSSGSLHPDAVLVLAGEDDSFAALPSAISGTLAAVGFSMLSHPQVILPTAPGVSNEGGEISGLGSLAGCFLALGSGLGLVGTVSAGR